MPKQEAALSTTSTKMLLMRRGGQTYTQKFKSYSPIMLLPMSETSGTTIADVSGNGIDGTSARDAGTMGSVVGPDGGSALNFDGANDYIGSFAAGLTSHLNEALGSAVLWFKPFGAAFWTETTNRYLFNISQFSTTRISVWKDTQASARFWFEFFNGSGVNQITTGLSYTDWTMVTITWNESGNVTYYLNDAATGSADAYPGAASDWTLNNQGTNIGVDNTVSANYYKGAFAYFGLFDTELDLAAVQDLYSV